MREYLVQVLFGQHKHITICLRPERERKEQVDFGQKKIITRLTIHLSYEWLSCWQLFKNAWLLFFNLL